MFPRWFTRRDNKYIQARHSEITGTQAHPRVCFARFLAGSSLTENCHSILVNQLILLTKNGNNVRVVDLHVFLGV
jgi:hypothetical protein